MTQLSIMEVLKESTRQQHSAIEHSLNLVDPSFTLESYSRLLERFYGFYVPWERACRPIADGLLAGSSRFDTSLPYWRKILLFSGVKTLP